MNNKILLMDFGSRFTNRIENVLNKLNIKYQKVKHDYDFSLLDNSIKGIIITGSHDTVYDGGRKCQSEFFRSGIPILGICYGHQLANYEFNGKVKRAKVKQSDCKIRLHIDIDNPLFYGMNKQQDVSMFHGDEVVELGEGFVCLAHADDCSIASTFNEKYQIYTVQYHPEYSDYADYCEEYFLNFAKICGL